MPSSFETLPYTAQAFLATLFTWAVTAAGAALVFFFGSVRKTLLDAMLGFAAGVMIAASFWSLLSPAIEMAASLSMNAWIVVLFGFLSGGILLFFGDKLFLLFEKKGQYIGQKRSLMLILSITLHNIPEGLAVGVLSGFLAAAFLRRSFSLWVSVCKTFPKVLPSAFRFCAKAIPKRKPFSMGN